MVHCGEREFYEEIYWEEMCCDTVLLEGVGGCVSAVANKIQTLMAKSTGVALVSQSNWFDGKKPHSKKWSRENDEAPWECTILAGPRNGLECIPKRVRYLRADLDDVAANKITGQWPLAMWCLLLWAPVLVIWAMLKLTRKFLIETLANNRDGKFPPGLAADTYRRFNEFVMDDRDEYLAAVLRREIGPKKRKHVIGITYGAAHMNKLHRLLLDEFGYKVVDQREIRAICARPDHIGSEADGYGIANAIFLKEMGLEFKPKVTEFGLSEDKEAPQTLQSEAGSSKWLKPENFGAVGSLGSHSLEYSFDQHESADKWTQNVSLSSEHTVVTERFC